MGAHTLPYKLGQNVFPVSSASPVPIVKTEDGLVMLAYGTTKPADTSTGYGYGCIFICTAGTSTSTTLYVNLEATATAGTSSVFTALTIS